MSTQQATHSEIKDGQTWIRHGDSRAFVAGDEYVVSSSGDSTWEWMFKGTKNAAGGPVMCGSEFIWRNFTLKDLDHDSAPTPQKKEKLRNRFKLNF